MAAGDRVFEFEPGIRLDEMLKVIRSALEDEGLTLAPEYSHGKITSVIVGGRCLVRVPESRIVTPGRDEEIRDIIRTSPDMEAALEAILKGVQP